MGDVRGRGPLPDLSPVNVSCVEESAIKAIGQHSCLGQMARLPIPSRLNATSRSHARRAYSDERSPEMRFGFIIAWHLPGGTLCDRSKRPDGSATGAAAIYATSVASSIGSTIEGFGFVLGVAAQKEWSTWSTKLRTFSVGDGVRPVMN